MNPISVLRFLSERLSLNLPFRRIAVQRPGPDDDNTDGLVGVTAPHGPRPRKGGAHAPLPQVAREESSWGASRNGTATVMDRPADR
ncbi:hypothetical protein [Deinococcus sp.]|uniref:hypothetical protein n=1 Tax=Deinococcus sp. TaxID=47478 RepID=UPI003B59EA90